MKTCALQPLRSLSQEEMNAIHQAALQILSPYFDLCPWGMGDSLDRERFEKRAAARVQQALAAEPPPVLTPGQEAAIDEVVKEAARDYKVQYPA